MSVCVFGTTVSAAKTAEPDPDPDAVWGQTRVDQKNHVLDWSAYGRHMANTIERSVFGGDTGCR